VGLVWRGGIGVMVELEMEVGEGGMEGLEVGEVGVERVWEVVGDVVGGEMKEGLMGLEIT
ncbi:hypothetical protein, partial [Corynebacterium glyciniphilum]|uniref:hypothetical protein n=1 Tax=Corynebacterium glyciniphilum TaxID=1404244 RepID=UPI001C92EDA7